MVEVVKMHIEKELKQAFQIELSNYCACFPGYLQLEAKDRPKPPKQEDYLLMSDEDEENLEMLDKIKEAMKQRIG